MVGQTYYDQLRQLLGARILNFWNEYLFLTSSSGIYLNIEWKNIMLLDLQRQNLMISRAKGKSNLLYKHLLKASFFLLPFPNKPIRYMSISWC